jgi:hypothetical protein
VRNKSPSHTGARRDLGDQGARDVTNGREESRIQGVEREVGIVEARPICAELDRRDVEDNGGQRRVNAKTSAMHVRRGR